MVRLFFGLPGCGKTTLMVANIIRDLKDIRYKHVYCNVETGVKGVILIKNEWIGKYCISDGTVHIDEATLFADSRDYKNFSKDTLQYFLMHRHYNVDISLYTQQWDGVDRKIRVITDRCYYVYKPPILGRWITKYYRIPYGIIIPDPKKDGSEKLGEIVQGYCKPSLIERLFAPSLYRPRYYKYFDSWVRPPLPALPLYNQSNPATRFNQHSCVHKKDT